MPLKEMLRELPALIGQAAEDARTVVVLQVKAHKEKDVIKLNCINDKLLQIRALSNVLDSERVQFEGTVQLGDRQQAFGSVKEHANEIRVLREQAQACAGEGELLQTKSETGWTGPDLPDDPARDLFPNGVEPPGYASPYN